ncbi:MAG: hypothetical protein ACFFD8_06215, partial [Candidatus Thorarchaeota archaeon]
FRPSGKELSFHPEKERKVAFSVSAPSIDIGQTQRYALLERGIQNRLSLIAMEGRYHYQNLFCILFIGLLTTILYCPGVLVLNSGSDSINAGFEPRPVILWDQSYHGFGDCYATCALELEDGSFIIGGPEESGVCYNICPIWGRLLRISANGSLLWSKSFHPEEFSPRAILNTNISSEFLVIGNYFEDDFDINRNYSIRLHRLNIHGKFLFNFTITQNSYYLWRAIQLSPDSIALITYDSKVLIINHWGVILSEQSYQEPMQFVWGAIPCSDSGFMLVGELSSSNPTALVVLRIGSNNSLVWKRTYSHPIIDTRGYDIEECPEGDFIIVGELGNISTGANGQIWRFDRNGNLVWNSTPSMFPSASFRTILIHPVDGYLIGRQKDKMGYLLQVDHTGQIIWQISLGIARSETSAFSNILFELIPLFNNDYLTVGRIINPSSTSEYMYWAVRFNETLMPTFPFGSSIIILYILGGFIIFGILTLFVFVLQQSKSKQ